MKRRIMEMEERMARNSGPEWWVDVSAGERAVIWTVLRALRCAKRSRVPDVARAAAKWERRLALFMKALLMHARRRRTAGS